MESHNRIQATSTLANPVETRSSRTGSPHTPFVSPAGVAANALGVDVPTLSDHAPLATWYLEHSRSYSCSRSMASRASCTKQFSYSESGVEHFSSAPATHIQAPRLSSITSAGFATGIFTAAAACPRPRPAGASLAAHAAAAQCSRASDLCALPQGTIPSTSTLRGRLVSCSWLGNLP